MLEQSIAKAVYAQPTTKALIEYLHGAPTLRRLCGWEREDEIPSEATFSRCFGEFAQVKLSEKIHEAVVKAYEGTRLVGHVSRDAPAIEARRYNERSSAERVFSYLEHYGAYAIYVRGTAKVMCHLMFALLALTAHQLYQLIV